MESLHEERRLLRRAQRGDAGAFSSLYQRFAEPLYTRILLPKLGNHHAAEDALADTFQSFLSNIQSLRVDEHSLWSWLARVASNKAMDCHRKRSRGRKALGGFERMMEVVFDADASGADLEERVGLQQAVSQCMAGINERYARAIQLRFFEMKTREEAAASLEVKLGTFDVILLRALRAFRKEWDAMTQTERYADAR